MTTDSKPKKILWVSLAIVVLILISVLAALPSILSSESGKNWVVSHLEKEKHLSVSIDSLSLSWFGPQKITKFSYQDNKQGFTFSAPMIESTASFWALLTQSGSIGTTTLTSPKLSVVALPLETLEKTSPSPSGEKGKKKQKTPKFKGRLIIDKGTLLVTQSESPLLTMSAISLDFQTGKEMIFKAEGNTKQEALIGSFSIHGKREKELEGEGKIVNFPVKGLDSAIGALMPKRRGYLAALLGDTLNATLKAKPTDGTLSISAAIRSPRLLIDLDGVYENEVLKLTRPARGALTVKPLLLKPWEEFALLQNDAQTELNLTSASLPFKHHRPHFEKLAAVGTAKFARGTFLFQDLNEPITLEQFILNFNTDELEKSLDLTLDLSARHKNHPPTAIAGTLTMHHILKKPEFPKMDLKLTNAPLALADAYFKGEASRYLGEMLSGKVAKTKEIFTLSAHTPLLTVDNIRLTLDRSAKLVAPATFQYRPGPALLPELNPGEEIQGTIKTLTIPLKKSALLFNEAAFNLDVLGERLFFTDLARVGGATVTTLKGNLQGTSLKAIQFKGEGDLQLGQNSLGQSLFGNQLKLSAEGKINLDQTLTLSPLLLKLDSPKFNGTIVGAIEDHLFYLKKGIEARFLLEPSQINPLLAKGENLPQMSAPTQMLLEVESGQFPLSEEKHSELSLKGSGKIQEITLRGSQTAFEFQDVVCKFDFDGKKEVNALRFEGTTLEGKAPAGDLEFHLKGKGKISELLSSPAQIALSLSNFSSKVADILFQTKGNLPSIVGQNLDFSLSMDKKDIDLTLSSPLLEIDGAFLAGDYLELRSPRKPLKIHWKMSEAGFIALRRLQAGPTKSHSPLFDMEGTSQIKLDVSSLQLPLEKREGAFPKVNFNLYKSAFDSKIRLETLHLKQKRAGLITKLERFDFSIAKKNIGEAPLFFKFSGEVSPFGAGGGGDIQGQGTLKNFLSPSKALDLSNVSTSVHAKLKNIPSVFIDALTQLDQGSEFPPSAFLGSLIDAQFDAEIDQSQGSITMDIDASACRARFAGRVSDGILSLSEPLQAIFTVTPEFNTLLKRGGGLVALVAFPGNSYHYLTDLSGIFPSHKISPCLMDNVVDFERRKPTKNLGATSGRNFRERPLAMQKAITLYIDPKGFNVPLNNLHIRNLNFDFGRLDMGEILCKNVGSASLVSGLFKMQSSGDISVWFAPCDFSMRQGNCRVARTEILYNRAYQVCLWGNVSFPRRYVNMTLGITAQALRAALGIQGIDDDYVLKVPVDGPFGNVKIDTGAVTGKIAFLITRKQIAPQTGIWGQVLGAIGDLADDQSDVPPPRPPFPWQK